MASVTTGVPAPDADGKLTEKLQAASLAPANGNGAAAATAEGGDDSDDDDEEGGEEAASASKKKKSKGKKKSGAAKKKAKAAKEKQANGLGLTQTSPEPTIGLSKIWPNEDYPEGETVPYDESKWDE